MVTEDLEPEAVADEVTDVWLRVAVKVPADKSGADCVVVAATAEPEGTGAVDEAPVSAADDVAATAEPEGTGAVDAVAATAEPEGTGAVDEAPAVAADVVAAEVRGGVENMVEAKFSTFTTLSKLEL